MAKGKYSSTQESVLNSPTYQGFLLCGVLLALALGICCIVVAPIAFTKANNAQNDIDNLGSIDYTITSAIYQGSLLLPGNITFRFRDIGEMIFVTATPYNTDSLNSTSGPHIYYLPGPVPSSYIARTRSGVNTDSAFSPALYGVASGTNSTGTQLLGNFGVIANGSMIMNLNGGSSVYLNLPAQTFFYPKYVN